MEGDPGFGTQGREPGLGVPADEFQDVASELQGIADRLARSIGRPVDFDDLRLRLLAHSSHPQQIDPVRLASILNRSAPEPVVAHLRALGVQDARDPVHVAAAPSLGMDARVCVPIRSEEALLGFLWLLDDGSVDEHALSAALGAAREAAEVLERARLGRIGALRRAQALVLEVLGEERQRSLAALGALVEQGLLARAELPTLALLADRERRAGPQDHRAAEAIAALRRHTAQGQAAFAIVPEGLIALLCLGEDDLQRTLTALLARRPDLVAGTAAMRPGEGALARKRAAWAAQAAIADPQQGTLRRWEAMGPYRYLAGLDRLGALSDLEPEVCELAGDPLGRELLITLECFLDLAGSASATASRLSLHRSSLYHRLARAEELLGVDLHDGVQRLDAHLAVKAARMEGLLGERPATTV